MSKKWQGGIITPTPRPTDGKFYTWDEPTLAWVEVTAPVGATA